MWNLPVTVEIDGKEHAIRKKCDYRLILDILCALNDETLEKDERIKCALIMFYENIENITDFQTAAEKMMDIINVGDQVDENAPPKPQVMDWQHDFRQLAPPISRVLGYSVRDEKNYTHWFDFIGAYMEIGDCNFAQIVSIRKKRLKGIKLDKSEEEYYRENRKTVDLPKKLSAEEEEYLNSDW